MGAQATRQDSRWAGVQIGMNVPYNFGAVRNLPNEQIVANCVALGVSAVELRAGRITYLPIKDRTLTDGPNTPFGEGDTPIREMLQAMRDREWTFPATERSIYFAAEVSMARAAGPKRTATAGRSPFNQPENCSM